MGTVTFGGQGALHQPEGPPGHISVVSLCVSPDGVHLRSTAQHWFLWSLFILLVSVKHDP